MKPTLLTYESGCTAQANIHTDAPASLYSDKTSHVTRVDAADHGRSSLPFVHFCDLGWSGVEEGLNDIRLGLYFDR